MKKYIVFVLFAVVALIPIVKPPIQPIPFPPPKTIPPMPIFPA